MDICLQEELQQKEVGDILRRAKAKPSSSPAVSTITLADYFSQKLSLLERRDKYLGLKVKGQKQRRCNIGNVILVVAILIATATYQSGISPPGGYWQDDYNPPANNTNKGQKPHEAGTMIMSPSRIYFFFTLNSIAFYASVSTILIIIMGLLTQPHYMFQHVFSC
ncbi:hypothetical protein COLO4_07197 [Corchorus olitorius]|uniref:PGG domain-containing protein n=1 Tax=Corchorus olitorius TaxID=93759 RepID=A0A1R3KKT1_9ROSI|nr:hypothetical protein COLO4_07197 [Corchorus olitorius]